MAVDQPTVAVIVPTFRRPDRLERLLASLRADRRQPDEIVVVDNDPESLIEYGDLPAEVRLVRGGFGINASAARNLGWRTATADVCIFVDDDNEVEPGFVDGLARACADPAVGLAGPVMFSADEGRIWCAGLENSRWTGITRCLCNGDREPPAAASWRVTGVPNAYALRRTVLESLGGLDENSFPIQGEEFDLGERVRALGLSVIVVRDARTRHFGNVSENPGEQLVRMAREHGGGRAFLSARSRVRVFRRHARGLPRLTTLGVFVPLWGVFSTVACLRAKAPVADRLTAVGAVWRGLFEGYRTPFPRAG
ncbi:MAG: glycosyltransferase family 2 protein [Acidimicrobiales bacterium]